MIGKKRYYISDAHLGIDSEYTSEQRETLLVQWLDEISQNAAEINLVGDIFDFWFEYKHVVPAGFVRLLAKLKELSDKGIKIKYYTGNHDMWIFGYLPKITGAEIIRGTEVINLGKDLLFIGHGDGLGPYDKKYNLLKKIFNSKFFQFLFKLVHPELSFRIALAWSATSRKSHKYPTKINIEDECLVKYAKTVLEKQHIDYFVFGHRHIPLKISIGKKTTFINLGDWLINFTYAVYDGEKMELLSYKDKLK
ncbi:MAG: UDP-2,3-diacylglucosamine diphosphatase [Bacteroidales bacterium]|nr:UDP-2,3-diacylglucosamine diphosphatase [Bacteroidales bacterium]